MDEVEFPQGVRKIHGIALLEGDAAGMDVFRQMGRERLGGVAFPGDLIRNPALGLDGLRSVDEGVGVVDADDFLTGFGKLEGGAADRTADVEGTGDGAGREEFGDGADRKPQGADRAIFPGQDFVVLSVMEEEVFIDEALGFVEVGHEERAE